MIDKYDIENAITLNIAALFRYCTKEEFSEGFVQKALMILYIIDRDSVPGLEIKHHKHGWVIDGLRDIDSRYYYKKRKKDSYIFIPDYKLINNDWVHIIKNNYVSKFVKLIADLYKIKGGVDNLTFVTLFYTEDGGFYEIGDSLYEAIENLKKILYSKSEFKERLKETRKYLDSAGRKIKILAKSPSYYQKILHLTESDPLAYVILKIINFIHPDGEDNGLDIILTLFSWLREEIKEIYQVTCKVGPMFKNLKEENLFADNNMDVNDIINKKLNIINNKILKNKNDLESKVDTLINYYLKWIFALCSGTKNVKEDYVFRESHWEKYNCTRCKGNKILAWCDMIGSTKKKEFFETKNDEETEVKKYNWFRVYDTVVKNFAIVFNGLVPSHNIHISGDQSINFYENPIDALLGSSFSLFFFRQLNKINTTEPKYGTKIYIRKGKIFNNCQIDFMSSKCIKLIKPEDVKLLEHTQPQIPEEGYIIIDYEMKPEHFGKYSKYLYESELIDKSGKCISKVYKVDIDAIVKSFVQDIIE